jgi:mono/diheme cytochrome c family protein
MSRTNSMIALGIVLLLAAVRWPAAGQEKASRSVRDGVYTASQAARGEAAYRENCKSCHGPELEGKGQNPALAGSDFASNWDGRDLGELFGKMQDTMPADRPGELSKPVNAAILAYILKVNRYPAGANDLPGDADTLRGIVFPSAAR